MSTLFTICAVGGGTLLVVQVLLLLIGMDSGGDADFDAGGVGDASDLADPGDIADDAGAGEYNTDSGEGASAKSTVSAFKFLSFKTIVAFFTFFGLTGLLGLEYEWGTAPSLTAAIGAGLVAFYLVGYIWAMLYRLESSGNVSVKNALGKPGRVYLSVPGQETGQGKVSLTLQGRIVEFNALTDGQDDIPTGTPVRIVGLINADTVKVLPEKEVKEGVNA